MSNRNFRMWSLSATVFILLWISSGSFLYADRHSESEVKKLLSEVETTFNDYVRAGVADYSPLEMQRARKYIESAKKMLLQDERDMAFYELKKAAAHFRLFDERRKMVNAELELDHSVKSAK